MAWYHRLVARILPNQIDARFARQGEGLLVSCWRYSSFVGIKQYEGCGEGATTLIRILFLARRQLYQPKRVTASRSDALGPNSAITFGAFSLAPGHNGAKRPGSSGAFPATVRSSIKILDFKSMQHPDSHLNPQLSWNEDGL